MEFAFAWTKKPSCFTIRSFASWQESKNVPEQHIYIEGLHLSVVCGFNKTFSKVKKNKQTKKTASSFYNSFIIATGARYKEIKIVLATIRQIDFKLFHLSLNKATGTGIRKTELEYYRC